jgi:hypothetical protein
MTCLKNPGRALPVVVLATPAGATRPVVDGPKPRTAGLGWFHVVVLGGHLAWDFSKPNELSVNQNEQRVKPLLIVIAV